MFPSYGGIIVVMRSRPASHRFSSISLSAFVPSQRLQKSKRPNQHQQIMRYKVTAMKPVEILAKVRQEEGQTHSGRPITRPAGGFEWIYLSAGEVRDGLELVIGVMASYVPNKPTELRMGKQTVLLPLRDTLPKIYFELFELENSAIPD